MKSTCVKVQHTVVTAYVNALARTSSVETRVISRAADNDPAEGSALVDLDPRLHVHVELTGTVIADEQLGPQLVAEHPDFAPLDPERDALIESLIEKFSVWELSAAPQMGRPRP